MRSSMLAQETSNALKFRGFTASLHTVKRLFEPFDGLVRLPKQGSSMPFQTM
jgi:hypothetical protein